MNYLKRGKKSLAKKIALFNPYLNGISTYDLAYLSSKRVFTNKAIILEDYSKKD